MLEIGDLIIFDEGHRLSRRQYGNKYDSSDRFDLAAKLRLKTKAMIILSLQPLTKETRQNLLHF